jgi:hypothetical protein
MSNDFWSIDPGHGVGEFTLGASREELLRSLRERNVTFDEDDDDAGSVYIDDQEHHLHFDEAKTLVEIEAESESLTLGDQPVIGQRLHQIVDRIGAREQDTAWTMESSGGAAAGPEPFDVLKSPRDEDLFDNGTLWIPRAGLGFVLWHGEVMFVRVRKPDDVPGSRLGPFTESQRALSQRPDLADHLIASAPALPATRGSWIGKLWTLATVAALGLLVWRAIDYQQKWNNAPVVEGEVVAVDPPPPDPFPDKFTVAYRDLDGNPHETIFGIADVYATRAVGDKLEVRYLPGAPAEPMGPARLNDAAFIKFMPWGIGIFAVYLGVQILGWIASSVFRAAMSGSSELKTTVGKEYD